MKKLLIPILSLRVLFACQKEKDLKSSYQDMSKKGSGPDYETYEYPEDYEDVLDDYLALIEVGDALDDQGIQEAVWSLEAGLNYVYTHKVLEYASTSAISTSYEFSLNSSDEVDGQEITDNFLSAYSMIEESTPDDATVLLTDVVVESVGSDYLNVSLDVVYAIHSSVVQTYSGIPPAVDRREAGTDQICPSGKGNVYTYQYVANLAFTGYKRSKYGSTSSAWGSASNIKRYGNSTIDQNLNVTTTSASKLFGQTQSAVAAYNSPASPTTCLDESEQDDYAVAMYDKCYDLVNPVQLKRVLEMNTNKFPDPFSGKIRWYYKLVRVGDWTSILTRPAFAPSPSLL